MKKTLKHIIQGTVLAAVSAMLISTGSKLISAENQAKNRAEYKTRSNPPTKTVNADNVIDVSGRWYKEAEGVDRSYPGGPFGYYEKDGAPNGRCYHWDNLWLTQEGTNIYGTYRGELYASCNVRGFINSNKLDLSFKFDDDLRNIVGVISNNVFYAENFDVTDKISFGRFIFTKIPNDLPLMDPFNKWGVWNSRKKEGK